jgi:hypothetical protein
MATEIPWEKLHPSPLLLLPMGRGKLFKSISNLAADRVPENP